MGIPLNKHGALLNLIILSNLQNGTSWNIKFIDLPTFFIQYGNLTIASEYNLLAFLIFNCSQTSEFCCSYML